MRWWLVGPLRPRKNGEIRLSVCEKPGPRLVNVYYDPTHLDVRDLRTRDSPSVQKQISPKMAKKLKKKQLEWKDVMEFAKMENKRNFLSSKYWTIATPRNSTE